MNVLLINGDPRIVRRDDETFYLETALRPGDRAGSGMAVTTTTVDGLADRRLTDFDVIFLCNVSALFEDAVTALEGWTKKGGGLFIAVGDHVDVDEYNAKMGVLLPQELRGSREAKVGAGAGPLADRIGRLEATHPIFAVFSAEAAGLREARFSKLLLLGPSTRGEERRTLASFESGAPALVTARLGAGRVLLYTSTLDRDWNDAPIHPGFLPFVQQAVRYLARAPSREGEGPLLVGQPRTLGVLAPDRRIEVTSPTGKKTTFAGDKVAGRQAVSFAGTEVPGFYAVAVAGADGTLKRRPGADFVVNVDPRGSDVRKARPEDLPVGGAPDGGVTVAATPTRRVELWHGVAAALLLFLLGEAVLVTRR